MRDHMTSAPDHDPVYMAEIERALVRNRSTIRTWERLGWLPIELEFHRDENDWRYWTREQLALALEWMKERNPGRVAAGKKMASA